METPGYGLRKLRQKLFAEQMMNYSHHDELQLIIKTEKTWTPIFSTPIKCNGITLQLFIPQSIHWVTLESVHTCRGYKLTLVSPKGPKL